MLIFLAITIIIFFACIISLLMPVVDQAIKDTKWNKEYDRKHNKIT